MPDTQLLDSINPADLDKAFGSTPSPAPAPPPSTNDPTAGISPDDLDKAFNTTPKPLNALPPIAQAMYNRRGQQCTGTECGQYISNAIRSHGGNQSVTNLLGDKSNWITPDANGDVPDGTVAYFYNKDPNKQHFVVTYKSSDGVLRGLEDTQSGAGGGGKRVVRVDRPIDDISREHGYNPIFVNTASAFPGDTSGDEGPVTPPKAPLTRQERMRQVLSGDPSRPSLIGATSIPNASGPTIGQLGEGDKRIADVVSEAEKGKFSLGETVKAMGNQAYQAYVNAGQALFNPGAAGISKLAGRPALANELMQPVPPALASLSGGALANSFMQSEDPLGQAKSWVHEHPNDAAAGAALAIVLHRVGTGSWVAKGATDSAGFTSNRGIAGARPVEQSPLTGKWNVPAREGMTPKTGAYVAGKSGPPALRAPLPEYEPSTQATPYVPKPVVETHGAETYAVPTTPPSWDHALPPALIKTAGTISPEELDKAFGGSNVPKSGSGEIPVQPTPPGGTSLSPSESLPVPQYIQDEIDRQYKLAQTMGVADRISDLAAQRLTKNQIAQELQKTHPLTSFQDLKEIVNGVRAKLGIPSMQIPSEFEAWIKNRQSDNEPITTAASPGPVAWKPAPAVKEGAESNGTHIAIPGETGVNLYGPGGQLLGEHMSMDDAKASIPGTEPTTPVEAPSVPAHEAAPSPGISEPSKPVEPPEEDYPDVHSVEEADSHTYKPDHMAGSINTTKLSDPELKDVYVERANRLNLNDKEPSTIEEMRDQGRSLGLTTDALAKLPVGWKPNNVHAGAWMAAVRDADAYANRAYSTAKRVFQQDPIPENRDVMNAAKDLADKTAIQRDTAAQHWGQTGSILRHVDDPFNSNTLGDLFKEDTPATTAKGKSTSSKGTGGGKLKAKIPPEQAVNMPEFGQGNKLFTTKLRNEKVAQLQKQLKDAEGPDLLDCKQ